MNELELKVSKIIEDKLGASESDIKPEANLVTDLGADSLDTVELIMEVERQFGIVVSDEDAAKIKTVGDIINFLEKQQ